jgi:hypothetical protein
MKNIYHQYINVPVAFTPTYIKPNYQQHNSYDLTFLNQEIKDWLHRLDLCVTVGEQFVRYPYQKAIPIHVDNPAYKEHVKLNYVYCDSEHQMTWYQLKADKEMQLATTNVGTQYAWADTADCEEVFSAVVGQPSLINAGVLHNVTQVATIRWCWSFSIGHLDPTKGLLTWDDAVEILKDHIVTEQSNLLPEHQLQFPGPL